jgi:CBS domain-containing protein
MPAKTIAQDDVVTADRETGAEELASTMASEEVGSVVIAENDEPVGVVTDRDIGLAVGEADDISSVTAEDFISGDPEAVDADAEAIEVARAFGEAKVRRLPVVDDGELVGVVSLDDVVATVGKELNHVADVIEAQSPGYSPDEE